MNDQAAPRRRSGWNGARAGLRSSGGERPAHRHRRGPAVPHRLHGARPGAADDARPPRRGRTDTRRSAPRGDGGRGESRRHPGPGAGRGLGRDGRSVRDRRRATCRSRKAAAGQGSRVLTDADLPARHLLALQAALPGAHVRPRHGGDRPAPDREGCVRGRAAPARGARCGSRRRPDRPRTAGRAHRGGREPRGPRAARRGGSRGGLVRDRRLGSELRLAAPRRGRPRDPGRRPDRPRHRRDGLRLRLGHHPHDLGDRR